MDTLTVLLKIWPLIPLTSEDISSVSQWYTRSKDPDPTPCSGINLIFYFDPFCVQRKEARTDYYDSYYEYCKEYKKTGKNLNVTTSLTENWTVIWNIVLQ